MGEEKEIESSAMLRRLALPYGWFFPPGMFFHCLGRLRQPRSHLRCGVMFSEREIRSLFGRQKIRSERQNFLRGSQPVWELWVQGHTFQLILDPYLTASGSSVQTAAGQALPFADCLAPTTKNDG
jgi:hypothetical protein